MTVPPVANSNVIPVRTVLALSDCPAVGGGAVAEVFDVGALAARPVGDDAPDAADRRVDPVERAVVRTFSSPGRVCQYLRC
jgi:hypothetical protein